MRFNQNIFDASQVGRRWNVSASTVRKIAARGELPYFMVGDRYRFHRKDVEEFERCRDEVGQQSQSEQPPECTGGDGAQPGETTRAISAEEFCQRMSERERKLRSSSRRFSRLQQGR